MTTIDIISGFLGAGKTTLIRKLLEEAYQNEKVVLIENEFGEIGIDGGFLKNTGIEISEMNSGCICCSLVGDFHKNLREILVKFHPDRVLIEPSGVGKLSDVMSSVIELEDEYDAKLGALVAVVNSLKVSKQMKAFGEFFNNQIKFATTVVFSRTQNATDEMLEQCVKQVQELNPKCAIITTGWDSISGKKILEVMERQDNLTMKLLAETSQEHDCGCEHEHDENHECCCGHHHHADEVFDTWGKETPHRFEKVVIENALKSFAASKECGDIIRSKGMVEAVDGSWIYFDYVDGEYELREGNPDYTGRLVVIGADLDNHKIEEAFGLC